jgi:predicted nucleotidyltransferase
VLAALRRALRTEPNVRLAVLYGSAARGDDREDSDADVLVSFADDRDGAGITLAVRLERALGREVDVARLSNVDSSAPLLLLQALNEGRVILDRDDEWQHLQTRRPEIERRADRDYVERCRRAREAVRQLLEDDD